MDGPSCVAPGRDRSRCRHDERVVVSTAHVRVTASIVEGRPGHRPAAPRRSCRLPVRPRGDGGPASPAALTASCSTAVWPPRPIRTVTPGWQTVEINGVQVEVPETGCATLPAGIVGIEAASRGLRASRARKGPASSSTAPRCSIPPRGRASDRAAARSGVAIDGLPARTDQGRWSTSAVSTATRVCGSSATSESPTRGGPHQFRCAQEGAARQSTPWVTWTSPGCGSSSPTAGCCWTTSRSGWGRAPRWRWSGPTAPARPRCCG